MAQAEPEDDALQDAKRWEIELTAADLGEDESTGVWVEHLPALEAFMAISTQWRMVATFEHGPRAIGLDYGAADVGLRNAGIEMTPELWSEVQMIEIGALEELNGTAK